MGVNFAAATAVQSIGDGRYGATVHDGWDIGGNANGGYLMAIAVRAMSEEIGRPPLTVTGHYLRPAPAGDCEIDVTTIRSGRRLATASATLSMGGKATLTLLATFGDQAPGGPSRQMEEPVELPAWEDSAAPPPSTEGPKPELMNRIDLRMHPDDSGFRDGQPSGRAEIRGWFALADAEPIDAIALMLAADAFPPPVFNSGLPVAWAPTVELTVHVRGVPAPGPLRCAFRSRFIHDGLLDEEGEIWDSTGTLVCQSRQLALTPR
ncbi:MAG: thioesterase family protein [Ilumatobacter sp.]|uniref:thioesterase family protein n=1 Tax=Ilumatobacter sp. TaxID=1967498 RepID=UPI003C763555